jgi:hypothetical protein
MTIYNYYRKLRWVRLERYNRTTRDGEGIDFDPAVRAYRSSPQRVALQLRGPESLKGGASEIHGVLATAELNRAEVDELIDRLRELASPLQEN